MTSRNIVSPDDQRVSFVELFFDLVFVFCVTQTVALLHHGLSWSAIGQATLVFWLVWWAWTQFTWALNAADTTNDIVGLGTLSATAIAFFMAIAIPDAFHGHAARFAIPYVANRALGLAVYGWVARAANPSQHRAVRVFSLISSGGLAAVLAGGLVGGTAQYWLWGLAIVLDIIAALVGGRLEGWNIHPEHFAERHGLFVIIALGECLIVVAGSATSAYSDRTLIVAVLAVATTCALWWTYFTRAKPALDHALASCSGSVQSEMARDVFTLLHFPMLCGVILYAVATAIAVEHPAEPYATPARFALAAGLVLFIAGMGIATLRARGVAQGARMVVIALTAAALVALDGIRPINALLISLAGLVIIAVIEQRSEEQAPHDRVLDAHASSSL
jgi:low temperature requirement protein LtrA